MRACVVYTLVRVVDIGRQLNLEGSAHVARRNRRGQTDSCQLETELAVLYVPAIEHLRPADLRRPGRRSVGVGERRGLNRHSVPVLDRRHHSQRRIPQRVGELDVHRVLPQAVIANAGEVSGEFPQCIGKGLGGPGQIDHARNIRCSRRVVLIGRQLDREVAAYVACCDRCGQTDSRQLESELAVSKGPSSRERLRPADAGRSGRWRVGVCHCPTGVIVTRCIVGRRRAFSEGDPVVEAFLHGEGIGPSLQVRLFQARPLHRGLGGIQLQDGRLRQGHFHGSRRGRCAAIELEPHDRARWRSV